MREIKFRAWHHQRGEMFDPMPIIDFKVLEINGHILMQYTGLKDKNGKDEYEGDIVQFLTHDNRGVITYEGYEICAVGSKGERFGMRGYEHEVIGNIYENPELLSNEQEAERSVATKPLKEQNDGKIN